MKILWLGTKPPWPRHDGGRLLVGTTLDGLRLAGHDVTLVAPGEAAVVDQATESLQDVCRPCLVARPPASRAWTLVRATLSGVPWTIARHRSRRVADTVRQLLQAESFDCIHVEQLQALAHLEPFDPGSPPVVLRAQNVESDLWLGAGRQARWPRALYLRNQGHRLATWEGAAVRRVATTIALTERDARVLARLAGPHASVGVVPPAFVKYLPAGTLPLHGEPALVLFGSGGWLPNSLAAQWFVRDVWPLVRARRPGSTLHIFGDEADTLEVPGAVRHPPPEDSASAFPTGAIQVLPLRVASGIRMRILEAWARGTPVVATAAAAAGLETRHGENLMLADSAESFAAAVDALAGDPALRAALISNGRQTLARDHDPARCTAQLVDVYRSVTSTSPTAARRPRRPGHGRIGDGDHPPRPLISVVVPTHDTRELTLRCLESLAGQLDHGLEVIVVDDASADQTAAAVERAFADTVLVRTKKPVGFTAAVNRGLACARGSFLVLLNSDTELAPEALVHVLGAFDERPELGVVGAQLYYPNGEPQWSGGPEPSLTWLFAAVSGVPELVARFPGYRRLRPLSRQAGREVAWVTGAAMAIRSEVWRETGPFDEGFLFYGQDLDYCLRAARLGWRIEISQHFRVMHHHGSTIRQRTGTSASGQNLRLLCRDLLLWSASHHGPRRARRTARVLLFGAWLRLGLIWAQRPFSRTETELADWRADADSAREAATWLWTTRTAGAGR